MPFFAEVGFIPVLSAILNLYVCNHAIGDSLTESYNYHDCDTFCFTNKHLVYLIIASITLLFYLPVSIYLRPYWQNFQTSINIKTNKRFLVFKSLIQLFLVVLSKTVAYSNPFVFVLLYCICLLSFAGVLLKVKYFSYKVANL